MSGVFHSLTSRLLTGDATYPRGCPAAATPPTLRLAPSCAATVLRLCVQESSRTFVPLGHPLTSVRTCLACDQPGFRDAVESGAAASMLQLIGLAGRNSGHYYVSRDDDLRPTYTAFDPLTPDRQSRTSAVVFLRRKKDAGACRRWRQGTGTPPGEGWNCAVQHVGLRAIVAPARSREQLATTAQPRATGKLGQFAAVAKGGVVR